MKQDRQQLIEDVRAAILKESNETGILEAAARLIDGWSEGFHWTGFYMMRNGALEVGPYVGPETPHTRIELNQGICGAAASEKQSLIVDDVRGDERFLACSLTTRSEIVVPLMDGETVIGEIDIDSNHAAFFTEEDREMFEEIAASIVARLNQIHSRR